MGLTIGFHSILIYPNLNESIKYLYTPLHSTSDKPRHQLGQQLSMSKEPIKKNVEKQLKEGMGVEVTPEGKLVYSIAEKESGTGLINHDRFLLLNCGNGTVSYSNDFPQSVPITSLNKLKPAKKIISIKEATFTRPKNKLNTIQISSPSVSYKGKTNKETWIFIFKSSRVAEQWMRELTHAKEFPLDQSILPRAEDPIRPTPRRDVFGDISKIVDDQQQKTTGTPIKATEPTSTLKPPPTPTVNPSQIPPPQPYVQTNPQPVASTMPSTLNPTSATQPYNPPPPTSTIGANQPQAPVSMTSSKVENPIISSKMNVYEPTPSAYQQPARSNKVEPVAGTKQTYNPMPGPVQAPVPGPGPTGSTAPTATVVREPIPYSWIKQTVDYNDNNLNRGYDLVNAQQNYNKDPIGSSNYKPTQKPFLRQQPPQENITRKPSTKVQPQIVQPASTNDNISRFKKPYQDSHSYESGQGPNNISYQDPNNSYGSNKYEEPLGPNKEKYNPMEPISRSQIYSREDGFERHPPTAGEIRRKSQKVIEPPSDQITFDKIDGLNVRTSPRSNQFDWNADYYEGRDQIQTMLLFRKRTSELAEQMIDQLALPPTSRTHETLKSSEGGAIFRAQGIQFKLAYIVQNRNSTYSSYQDHYVKSIRNQFRNYNYANKCLTKADGVFKVPLCQLIEYKGVTCLAKAVVQRAKVIDYNAAESDLSAFQGLCNVRKEIFMNPNYAKLKYVKSRTDVIYLDELVQFLPLDIGCPIDNTQFRGQYLKDCQTPLFAEPLPFDKKMDKRTQKYMVEVEEASKEVTQNVDRLLNSLEILGSIFLSHSDLKQLMHSQGVPTHYLPILFKSTSISFFKQIFFSEMCAIIFKNILNKELCKEVSKMSSRSQKMKLNEAHRLLLNTTLDMLNSLFSRTEHTESLWSNILLEVKRRYQTIGYKQDIKSGYFLSSVLDKANIKCSFQVLNKRVNTIGSLEFSHDFIESFKVKSKTMDLAQHKLFKEVNKLLDEEPSERGFQALAETLNLHQANIPQWIRLNKNKYEKFVVYCANFVSANVDRQAPQDFQHLKLYQLMTLEPPTADSIKLSLMAIKWAIKCEQQKVALDIYQHATEVVTYWGGEFHPMLSDFDDFFSLYYLSTGDYEQAINVSKYSLTNISKIFGPNNLCTAQKYYQLGNIYFKIGRKQEAYKEYSKTRDILAANRKTTSPQYALILHKLALINLSYGRIQECIDLALVGIRIFEQDASNEEGLLDSFELLARAYQVTQNNRELVNLGDLASQKLNGTDQPRIMERMLKLAIYPHLVNMPSVPKKQLVSLIENLEINRSNPTATYNQAFNYLRRRAHSQAIAEKFLTYLLRIERLSNEINNKDLIRKHKGLQTEGGTEAQDFLILLEAIVHMIDQSFIVGVLKEDFY